MFFAAFFGALFYARQLALPWLAGDGAKQMTNALLWPHFEGGWPSTAGDARPRADGSFETIPALGVPLVNTLILLSSGVTVTIAHHALRANQRLRLTLFLAATFVLDSVSSTCRRPSITTPGPSSACSSALGSTARPSSC